MARLLTLGFELKSVTAGIEFDSSNGTGTKSISTATKKSGAASLRVNPTSDYWFLGHQYRSNASTGKVFARFLLNIASLPNTTTSIFAFAASTTGGNSGAQLRLTTSGSIELGYFNGSWNLIGTSSTTLSTNTFYRIEISYDDSVANNTAILYINGNQEVTGNGNDLAGNGCIQLGNIFDAGTEDLYFDDIAVNDTNGSFQNNLPGDGNIILLSPSAAGDVNTFATQTGGTAGAANNFTRVDELPPNDATDFNGSAILNQEDLFNVTDSGIGASDRVNVVEVGLRFRNSTADTAATIKAEIEKTGSGTKTQSAGITPNSTTWKTNATAAPKNSPIITYQDPDGAAWTQTTLDSMQIGYKLTTGPGTAGRRVDVSAVWAYVDYTTAPAISVSDAITTTESTSVNLPSGSALTVSVSENISVSESINSRLTSFISKSDSITLTETVAASYPLSSISDDFNDNSLDTNKWVTYTAAGGSFAETNQHVEYSLGATTNGSWSGINSKNRYDLTNDSAIIRFVSATTGNSWLDLTLSNEELPIVDNFISIGLDIGRQMIQVVQEIAGSDSVLYEEAYNPNIHKWGRIRENSGTVYWDYSTDGINWINLYSAPPPVPINQIYVVLDDYEYDGLSTPNVHILDSFNIPSTQTTISVSDSVSTTENIGMSLGISINVSENISISESVNRLIQSYVNVSDTASISETTIVALAHQIAVADRINVLDPGYSIKFDGSQNYVLLKSGSIVSGLTNWYISARFMRPNTTINASGEAIYAERASTGSDIVKVDLFGAAPNIGKVGLTYRDNAGTLTQLRTTSTYNDGVFHTISIKKVGTAITINVDGDITTGTVAGTDNFTNAGLETRVGGDKGDPNANFEGIIDEVTVGTDENNLTGYWAFNDGSGTSTADSVGTNTGTLTGTPLPLWLNQGINLINAPSVSDSITVSESINVNANNASSINVSDSINVAESLSLQENSFVSASDSISLSENINVTLAHQINVSDSITLTETTFKELNSFITVTDSITTTENIIGDVPLSVQSPALIHYQPFGQSSIPPNWQEFGNGTWTYDGATVTQTAVGAGDPQKVIYTGDTSPLERVVQALITFNSLGSTTNDRTGITILGDTVNGKGYNLVVRSNNSLFFLNDLVVWGPGVTINPAVGESWWIKGMYRSGVFYGKAWKNGTNEPDWLKTWTQTPDASFINSGITGNSSSLTTKASFDEFSFYGIPDSITLTESATVSVQATTTRTISVFETISLTESTPLSEVSFISVSDSIAISESINNTLSHQINLNDSISVAELINNVLGSQINISDTITTSESTQLIEEINISVNDSISVAEASALELESDISILVSDTVTATENIIINVSAPQISVSDSISTAENINIALVHQITVTDNISAAESINRALLSDITVADNIGVSDSDTILLESLILTTESISVIDTPQLETNLQIRISDSISISETINQLLESSATVSDTISTTDTAVTNITLSIGITENISVTESVIMFTDKLYLSVSENITVNEQLSLAFARFISVSDSISLSESISLTEPHIVEYINKKLIFVDGRLAYLIVDSQGIPHYTLI